MPGSTHRASLDQEEETLVFGTPVSTHKESPVDSCYGNYEMFSDFTNENLRHLQLD